MFSKKTLLKNLLLTILFFSFCHINNARAATWPAVDPMIETALDKMIKVVNDMGLAAGKKKAVMALNQEMDFAIGGGSMFITDWRFYLIDKPNQQAGKYLNDYLSQATSGRGSLSGYISTKNFNLKLAKNLSGKNYEGVGPGSFRLGLANNDPAYANFIETANAKGFSLKTSAGNYINKLVEGAKEKTINKTLGKITYTGNPSEMFAAGNFKGLSIYASGINNPWAFNNQAEEVYNEEKEKQEKIASNKAVAGGGFTGKEKDGVTMTPGKVVEGIYTKSKTMAMDVIANAGSLPEIITTAIINKAVDFGIESAQAGIHKEIQEVKTNISAQVNTAAKEIGPAAFFKK